MHESDLKDRAVRAADSIMAELEPPEGLDAATVGLVHSALTLGWTHGHAAGMLDGINLFGEAVAKATTP